MSENELIAYRSINAQLVQNNIKLKEEKHLIEAEKNELWKSHLELRRELTEARKENCILMEVLKNQHKQNKMMMNVLLNANNNFQKLFPHYLSNLNSTSLVSSAEQTDSDSQKTVTECQTSKEITPKVIRRISSSYARTSLKTISPTRKSKRSIDLPKRNISDCEDEPSRNLSSDMEISNSHQTSIVNESIAEENEEIGENKENQEPTNENKSEDQQYLKLSTLVEERSSQLSSVNATHIEPTVASEMDEGSMEVEESTVQQSGYNYTENSIFESVGNVSIIESVGNELSEGYDTMMIAEMPATNLCSSTPIVSKARLSSNLKKNQMFDLQKLPNLLQCNLCLRKFDDEDLRLYEVDINKLFKPITKSTSMESVSSTGSQRPKRRAAPVCMKEPSVGKKLRR